MLILILSYKGNNWRDNDNDGGPENIGVVFRVHSDATVSVCIVLFSLDVHLFIKNRNVYITKCVVSLICRYGGRLDNEGDTSMENRDTLKYNFGNSF